MLSRAGASELSLSGGAAAETCLNFTIDTQDAGDAKPAVSGEFIVNTRSTNSGSTNGRTSGVFAVDTRAVDSPSGFAVSGSPGFTIDTRRYPSAADWNFTGHVRDTEGRSVPNATVKLSQIGQETVFAVTGSDGRFSITRLPPSAYRVEVSATFYSKAVFSIDGSRGGSQSREVQLQAALVALNPTPDGRLPTSAEIFPRAPAQSSKHVFWNRATGTWSAAGSLNPGLPTVIMTHGWASSPDAQADDMAQGLINQFGGLNGWNIVAWDWKGEAAFTASNVLGGGQQVPSDKTRPQGELLGQALQTLLGAGYSRNVHFIGHSLGTLVNRYACDWLHQPTRWAAGQTQPHITLLDEAELASVGGVKVLSTPLIAAQQSLAESLEDLQFFDALNPGVALGEAAARATFESIAKTLQSAVADWKSPIPESAAFVDNYVSAVGWNVSL